MLDMIRNGIISAAIAFWNWLQMAFLYTLIGAFVIGVLVLVTALIYAQDKANGKY